MTKDMHDNESATRRNFIKAGMVAGVGALLSPLLVKSAQAAAEAAPAAAPAAAAAAAGEKPKLKIGDVLRVAREKLYPICRVCPECDGVACAGEVPGMGGIGSGQAFKNNYNALNKIDLVMRTFHDVKKPDLTTTLFGHKLSMPVTSAVTGGVTYNMGGKMTEEEYVTAILGGCLDAGTLGWVADGIGDKMDVFERRIAVLKNKFGGNAIVTIKPKLNDEIIKRFRLAEEAGAIAVAIDIDSAGRAARAVPGQTVEPKTPRQLAELAKSTKLPFIIKGIMTVEEAKIAVDVGARGIGVSNHGGRVLDYTPATATVLPAIADAVKGKVTILVDGAVRRGQDVLKYLAMGADVCLCGRPLVRGAHGAGRDGVALMMNIMKNELTVAMTLTGVPSVKNVPANVITKVQA
jgi:isopentenyl diphosphate isomerase/L-lactate dehydrogenase-like FMN-dependent dehydrogenase